MKVDDLLPLSWQRVVFAVAVALFASFTIEPVLEIVLPLAPALPLVVIVIIAASNGPLIGVMTGLLTGLLLDLLGAGAVGVQAGSMATAGYLIGVAIRYVPLWPRFIRILVVAPLMILSIPVAWLLTILSGDAAAAGFRHAMTLTSVNILFVAILLPFLGARRAHAD
jgi:rod shape-determining protein MreD